MSTRQVVANIVMTVVAAIAVSVAMLPMITTQTDATSAFTPGKAPAKPARVIAMEAEDRAAFPGCQDIRAWEPNWPARHVLVVRSNGERVLMETGAAFAQVAESKQDPALSIWVIGACPR